MDHPANPLSRRKFLEYGSAAALAGTAALASAQSAAPHRQYGPDTHTGRNETDTGPQNKALDLANPSSDFPPESDHGAVQSFKYPFSLAHKRVEDGGWTRQVTVRDFPISKSIAGVNMRLTAGGVRELHWHKSAEWAMMLYGNARITAIDPEGHSFVSDVCKNDLWFFPAGIPHSVQGLGPDGCEFLLVFDDGSFNEYETFLITDWMHHTPPEVLAKNFGAPPQAFERVPSRELYIFQATPPGSLADDKRQAAGKLGPPNQRFDFPLGTMAPTVKNEGGEVYIVDSKTFPVSTTIAAALVRLRPRAMRELHWHPNADEWQYFIAGKGRMTVFGAGTLARTMDFEAGDVGYVNQTNAHYVENTGDEDLAFLEIFRSSYYQDVSLSQWIAHTPEELVKAHLHLDDATLRAIPRTKRVIVAG